MADSGWPLVDHAPPLGRDDVHVWQASLEGDEQLEQRFTALLAPDEHRRAARFHFQRDRRRYTFGRGWLRVLLAEYLRIPARAIPLSATPLGKPHLAETRSGDLSFNLAHSDDMVVVAFSCRREIGVDIERERHDVAWRELAERYFAPEEVLALSALTGDVQREAFYRCWTRKEAYLKALGLGMQVPLDGFAVTLTGPPALIHTAHDSAQRDRWTLSDLAPADGFAGALAVEGAGWGLFCAQRTGFP
jgi:4'-phosphopantetheinyl transferase